MLPYREPQAEAGNHSAILTKPQAAEYLQATPRYIEHGRRRAAARF